MSASTHYFMCIPIEPATEEVVYKVIAEPREQTDQAQQEIRENPAKGPTDSTAVQQPEGKPRCMSY